MREGITLGHLHQLARALSDVQAAENSTGRARRCSGVCPLARNTAQIHRAASGGGQLHVLLRSKTTEQRGIHR